MSTKCYSCGTYYDGWSCPVCSAKDELAKNLKKQSSDIKYDMEKMGSALEETAAEIEESIQRGLREQEEMIEEAIERQEQIKEEIIEEQERITSDAWKLQAEAKVGRAGELYNAGLYEEAIHLCMDAIKQDPGNIYAYTNAALSFKEISQDAKAKNSLKKAISLIKIGDLKVLSTVLAMKNNEDLLQNFLDAAKKFTYFPAEALDILITSSLYDAAQELYHNTLNTLKIYNEIPYPLLMGFAYEIELNNRLSGSQDTDRLNKFLKNIPHHRRTDIIKVFNKIKNKGTIFSDNTVKLLREKILERYREWKQKIKKEFEKTAAEEAKSKLNVTLQGPYTIGWLIGIGSVLFIWYTGSLGLGILTGPIIGILTFYMAREVRKNHIEAQELVSMEKDEEDLYSDLDTAKLSLELKGSGNQKVFSLAITLLVVIGAALSLNYIETGKPPASEVSKEKKSTSSNKKKSKKEGSTAIVPVSLSGTWDGYYFNYGRKINFQLKLNQNGSSISGSTYETYEDGSYTANFNGDIRGNSINFVKNMEGRGFEPIEYVGTLSDNKITLFGKWYIRKTGLSGEWSATKRE